MRKTGRHRALISLPIPLPRQFALMCILLLDLLDLLVDLLAALGVVPVVEEHGASILNDLELRAHDGETSLDEAVLVRRALVLLLPRAGDVLVGREGIVLEHGGVLLDDGHVRLELVQAAVTKLVRAGEIWVRDRVGALQVGVEGSDEAAVCVGCEVECAGTDVGVAERLDRVVNDWVGFEMLDWSVSFGAELVGVRFRAAGDWVAQMRS
jgi:hypothetical protein